MLYPPEDELIERIRHHPLDEEARLQYEAMLRIESPDSRKVLFLELDRRLGELSDQPDQFEIVFAEFDELYRTEFSWDDREWTYIMWRRFDVWLDFFDSSLWLAVKNALRLRCEIEIADEADLKLPFKALSSERASQCKDFDTSFKSFICRYDHRPQEQVTLTRDELILTIRPAWLLVSGPGDG